MRILAIRGRNLASLRGDFEVALDQAPLKQAGLFAITGHTGSGKSTLLDAMCLALFDKIPRLMNGANVKIGRSDEDEKLRISSNDVASIVSRGTSGAYAEVDFIGLDKHTYQAHWEIKRARNKVSGRLQKQSVVLTNLDTNKILGQNKSDTLEIISERIGLTFEQFRRSVLLAQGDFAAFLKAKSDERSALLERITGTEIYTQLSILAYRNFQDQEQQLNSIKDKINDEMPLENQQRQDLQIIIAELADKLLESKSIIDNCHSILQWYEAKEELQKDQISISHDLAELKQEIINKEPLNKELQKVISIQSLRPLLQYLDKLNEKKDAFEKQLNQVSQEIESEKAVEEKLLADLIDKDKALKNAEQQYQKIKPELIKIRELDTKIQLIDRECSEYEIINTDLSASLKKEKGKEIDLNKVIGEQKKLEQLILNTSDELSELKKQRQMMPFELLKQQKETIEQQYNELQNASQLCQSYREIESNLKQYQQKQIETQEQQAELIKNTDLKNAEYKVSLALIEEAKHALTIMQESVTKDVKSLRNLLNEKQECPVCGSIEHPWAEQDSILNEQYKLQGKRVNELEKIVQSNLIAINNFQQKINQGETEQLKLNEQCLQLSLDLKNQEMQWQKKWHKQVVINNGPEFKKLNDFVGNYYDNKYLLPEIQHLNTQLELNKEQEQQAIFVQKKMDEKQLKKDQYQHDEKALGLIISDQKIVLNKIDNLQQQYDVHQQELTKKQQHKKNLADEQQSIFAGELFTLNKQLQQMENNLAMDANTIDMLLTHAIEQLLNHYNSEKLALEKTQQRLIKATEQGHYLQQHLQQNKQQKTEQEVQLNSELEKHSLELSAVKLLLKHDQIWIKQQQDDFKLLHEQLIKSQTLLLERDSKLTQHNALFKQFPKILGNTTKSDLSEQVKEQRNNQKILQNTQQENQLQLKLDDERKQRVANFREELNAQQESWSNWAAINELIGSASGQKFRIFAQSLTLESLLAHANEHLNDFARRYQLQRVPGTDLDLQIMDRDMADEVRSVQSLSGGESFLVSLALALGLASLSATKTQVESLFIDEGFGTLDQETLDIAIASLDTLQGLGRKVGIISHVPILVERIGVRVVVEKMGGGQSRVYIAC